MKVVQILKSKADDGVVTVMPGSDVGAATEILAERKIGTVVVSPDGETAVGILSERDIVRELARIGASCLRHSVEDYMTSHLVTCTRDESADLVLSKMDTSTTTKRQLDYLLAHLPAVSTCTSIYTATVALCRTLCEEEN